ncbi:MAG: phytanoyl-CoA dioxygenase family protein [Pseudomonadales bacterium]|nr:phytanoyl-CoA dioxygenase family protein [Pseudomonadales bacterium]
MSRRELQIRPADTPSEELTKILERDGCVVLKDFASKAEIEAIQSDLRPFIDTSSQARSDFSGLKTTRTGALMARSPRCRELAIDPRILSLVETFLAPYANTFQLHVTQVIRVLPGEKVQMPHRDRWAWSQLQDPSDLDPPVNSVIAPLLTGVETQLNTMLALTDFTKENGATRIVPGSSHLPDSAKLPEEAYVSAEMTTGSMLVFTGSVFHGAGANMSERERIGLNIDYSLGWLRQEDNQYLSCPPEIAKDLDPKLQALLGYAVAEPSLGYFTPPLPAGEDLSSPQRALQQPSTPVRLDADGRPEFVE